MSNGEGKMKEIINLLAEKNDCLQKFLDLNKKEIENFNRGHFDNLRNFYENREVLLQLINKIDDQIGTLNIEAEDQTMMDDACRRAIVKSLAQRKDLVTNILALDLEILSLIEVTKSQIIKDLVSVRAARKAIKGYHSGPTMPQLDEKA